MELFFNETTVQKVIPENLCSAYPNYLFCMHYCKCDTILAPMSVEYKDNQTYIVTPRAEPLTENSNVDLIQLANDIIEALAYLECYDLTHGDIKPQNIVFYKGRYCLIDFDLLPHIKSLKVSQSHRDVYGEANKLGIIDKNFNQTDQAMYALVYTLFIYASNRTLFNSYTSVPITLNSYGINNTIHVTTTAKDIYTDPEAWINLNFDGELQRIVAKLIGPDKVKCFRELCPVELDKPKQEYKINNGDSKFLHELAENCRYSLVQLFHCYNLFYRYPGYPNDCYTFPFDYKNDELIKLNKGLYITEYPSSFQRFEEEYLNKGTWVQNDDDLPHYPTELSRVQNLFQQNKESIEEFFA